MRASTQRQTTLQLGNLLPLDEAYGSRQQLAATRRFAQALEQIDSSGKAMIEITVSSVKRLTH
jgi:hypothetical protein